MLKSGYLPVFLFLVFALGLSNASVIWKYDAGTPLTTKPVLFDNSFAAAGENGFVYLVSQDGKLVWRREVGRFILPPLVFQDELVVASSSGKITFIKKDGVPRLAIDLRNISSVNSSAIYGIAASNRIYLTTDTGVLVLDRGGNVTRLFSAEGILTPPYADAQQVIFGAGNELISMKPNGGANWRREIAPLWGSAPVVDGSTVYIGAQDNSLYAISTVNGEKIWQAAAGGWVTGEALVESSGVYFGSNDGYAYAVEKPSGALRWKSKTQNAVEEQPVAGTFGGRDVVFVSGTDGNIYAFDKLNGDKLWQMQFNDWVSAPLVRQGRITFSSRNSELYSADVVRGCSIDFPEQGAVLGPKEVKVLGKAVSQSGGASVGISVNEGPFENAETSDSTWVYTLRPDKLVFGTNTIACRVSDAAGAEVPPYTMVFVMHASNISNSKFVLSYPSVVEENKQFTVFVNDGEDNSPVENFKLAYGGKDYEGSSNITLKSGTSGSHSITIRKIGFDDATISVNVRSSSNIFGTALPIIAAVGVVFIIYQAYRRFVKKS
jgi:outer membrane protein assembly factor BamB